jgi:hypothetical protein
MMKQDAAQNKPCHGDADHQCSIVIRKRMEKGRLTLLRRGIEERCKENDEVEWPGRLCRISRLVKRRTSNRCNKMREEILALIDLRQKDLELACSHSFPRCTRRWYPEQHLMTKIKRISGSAPQFEHSLFKLAYSRLGRIRYSTFELASSASGGL